MLTFANAKINIGLYITEKRPDGYHNLETVFYPVNLNDVVELIDVPGGTDSFCITKGIVIPGDSTDNLCLKAFRLLKKDFNLPEQQIVLLKNIPVGAGLGGGSADAAFLIKLVNEKFKLGLSVSSMEGYARQIGADCAFFIGNKPVYAFGKGDQFESLSLDLSKYFIVLVKPQAGVSTAEAYAQVSPKSAGHDLREVLRRPMEEWRSVVVNDFEASIAQKYPEIEEIKTKLYHAGATFASMSGSGSAVFGIFKKPVKLEELEKDNLVFYGV